MENIKHNALIKKEIYQKENGEYDETIERKRWKESKNSQHIKIVDKNEWRKREKKIENMKLC